MADAKSIWKIARDAQRLDSNPAYFYLLWCHEFANTSVVATVDRRLAGFLLGYVRQEMPDTLVVWQDAVDPSHHVSGLRLRMMNEVIDRNLACGVNFLETTATPGDKASSRIVERVSRQRDARLTKRVLFNSAQFPDGHPIEILFSIGPFVALHDRVL